MKLRKIAQMLLMAAMFLSSINPVWAWDWSQSSRAEKRKKEIDEMQPKFAWWPTDAQPGPVQDPRGGFWWWPKTPGQMAPWGNRGYIYVYKIIYDYKAEEEPAPVVAAAPVEALKAPEPKPSLIIKRIIKNVKIYFDYNKADLRSDHTAILQSAVRSLQKNPEASILITGNCDARGSVEYNEKLGKRRGESVMNFMIEQGIPETRIKIVSRGKLDAVAPVKDLVGMQKDRNAQFMIAEVDEVSIPSPEQVQQQEPEARPLEEGKFIVEKSENVETELKVSTREYVIKKNDSLWNIAAKELGSGHRWKYLYEINKDRIKDSKKLKVGQTIIIPIE